MKRCCVAPSSIASAPHRVPSDAVHEETEHFVRGHEIRLDLLESMEPHIRPIEWGRELPRKAGDMNPYIRLFERQVSQLSRRL